MKLLAQKLSEPASLVNVQHMVLPAPAFVQSLGPLHSCTCSVPEQLNPASFVGQDEAD